MPLCLSATVHAAGCCPAVATVVAQYVAVAVDVVAAL